MCARTPPYTPGGETRSTRQRKTCVEKGGFIHTTIGPNCFTSPSASPAHGHHKKQPRLGQEVPKENSASERGACRSCSLGSLSATSTLLRCTSSVFFFVASLPIVPQVDHQPDHTSHICMVKSVPECIFKIKKRAEFFFLVLRSSPRNPQQVVEFRFLYWFQGGEKEHDLAEDWKKRGGEESLADRSFFTMFFQ